MPITGAVVFGRDILDAQPSQNPFWESDSPLGFSRPRTERWRRDPPFYIVEDEIPLSGATSDSSKVFGIKMRLSPSIILEASMEQRIENVLSGLCSSAP